MTLSLVWLRRDLRLHDHAALSEALSYSEAIQPVFIFDTDILARFTHPQDRRLTFLMQTLCQLHEALQQRGGGLLVAYGRAQEILPKLAEALKAQKVFAARDHEPAARERDRIVFQALKEQGRALIAAEDNFLIFPGSPILLNGQGEPYKVFTPFARHWRKTLPPNAFAEKKVQDTGRYADFSTAFSMVEKAGITLLNLSDTLENLLGKIGYQPAESGEWQPQDAQARIARFVRGKLAVYADTRNLLAEDDGTSHLSPYLRFGLVSVRECARLAVEVEGLEGAWINELIWRDFYAMVLYHLPQFPQQEFYEKYRNMPWNRDEVLFRRWCEGLTGYPVVDAAMRQLTQTGWMHNRARMIVASFLTKHLLIDWRWGEEFFAQHLMDYELSSNAGGWQWAASTGIDPQPYFRIFNPTTQGQRFDPEGVYIRRYVPELRDINPKHLHEPWKGLRPQNYPAPIVNHEEARKLALEVYKNR